MVICYIIWGDKTEFYAESAFSILTFLADPDVEDICVVTEHPDYYAMFGDRVRTIHVAGEVFRGWQGTQASELKNKMKKRSAKPRGFTFRGKIKGLEMVVDAYPGRDIMYLDTDTFLGAPIRPIKEGLAKGEFFMNELYGHMVKCKLHTTKELWGKLRGGTFGGIGIDENTTVWNSGTVGLPAAYAKEAVASAEKVCDDVYLATGYEGAEELGFAVALNHYGEMKDTVSVIGHYWTNKTPWVNMILAFLAKCHIRNLPLAEQIREAAATDFRAMPVEIHHPTRRRQILRFADKYFPPNRPKYYPDKLEVW